MCTAAKEYDRAGRKTVVYCKNSGGLFMSVVKKSVPKRAAHLPSMLNLVGNLSLVFHSLIACDH